MDKRTIALILVILMIVSTTNALPKSLIKRPSHKKMRQTDLMKALALGQREKRDCWDSHWSCFYQKNYEDVCNTIDAEVCSKSCGLC